MRGFGFTSYNYDIKGFQDLAEDMYIFMEEQFTDINDYFIFGNNIGGLVAMHLA